MSLQTAPQAPTPLSPRQFVLNGLRASWWVWLFVAALLVALSAHNFLMLKYVHIICAILWTGTDLFMGFVVGPVLRAVAPPVRGAIVQRLMPRMLFYMPVVAASTTTAGWYLAEWRGLWSVPAAYWWLVSALILAGWMFIQGLGILLPINLRVFFEAQKERPDVARVQRLMSRYKNWVAFQGLLQLCIIFIMVNL